MCFLDIPSPIDWQRASEVMKFRGNSLNDYEDFRVVAEAYLKSEHHKNMQEYRDKMIRLQGKRAGNTWYKKKVRDFLTIVEYERGPFNFVIPYFLVGVPDWRKDPLYKIWVDKVNIYLDKIIQREPLNKN
jgi:hypothetical protein